METSDFTIALPDDCWELVFRSLGDERLLHPVSLVCRSFLSITNRLRSNLTVSDQAASRLSRRFPNLRRIAVSDFHGDLDRLVRDMAGSSLKLEAVDLHGLRQRFPRAAMKELGSRMGNSLKALNVGRFLLLENEDVLAIADSFPNLEFLDISHPQGELDRSWDLNRAVTDGAIEALSSNLRYLKSIRLSGNPFLSDSALVSLSKNCPNLTDIVAQDCSFIRGEGIAFVLHHSPRLASLSVNSFPALHTSIGEEISGFHCMRALRHLSLSQMLVPDDLLASLRHSPIQIQKLSLSYCWGISSSGLSSFLHAYGGSLQSLILTGLSFLSDATISSVLPHLSRLNSINLSGCCDLGSPTFFSIMQNCPCIEHIEMRKTSIGRGPLPSSPCLMKRLKSLRLAENPYLDDRTIEFIARSCPQLSSLDISSCWDVTDEGMRSVGESCPEITELQMKGCTKIKSLGYGLGFQKLTALRAAGSGINDEGLSLLAQRCKALLLLDLDGCLQVTQKGVKEVALGCRVMQELYVGCPSLDFTVLHWIMSSKLLLRKIVWQSGFLSAKLQDLFLRHGCVVRTL